MASLGCLLLFDSLGQRQLVGVAGQRHAGPKLDLGRSLHVVNERAAQRGCVRDPRARQ